MIELINIKKEYQTDSIVTKALDGISFQVKEGEFLAIVGPSGSGKSTLLHILGFLDKPTSGIYKFFQRDVNGFSDDELAQLRNKKIGFVFQLFHLLARMTVFENVRLPLVYSTLAKKAQTELVKEALKKVFLLEKINKFPNQLSGGEQQRVAIARAIVNNPAIILADEPTGNLDWETGKKIMTIFKKLNEEGKTIILVTHEREIANFAKRIVQLRDGKIISDNELS